MDPGAADLADENRRLKKLVYELEEKLSRVEARAGSETAQVSNVVKLLKQKDSRLGEMYEELEVKNDELEKVVQQLKRKNDELTVWISSLRLYQDIFENEPAVMIGLNLDAKILLFNQAAGDHFGDAIKAALMKDVDALDFGSLDPYAPTLARQVLKNPEKATRAIERDGNRIETWAFPIRVGEGLKGVLLKIGVEGR